MRSTRKRALRNSLIMLLVVAALQLNLFAPSASAVTQAQINALKGDAGGLKSEKAEIQAQIDAIKNDKAQALRTKELLDQQSDVIRKEIANTQAQIDAYETLIGQTQEELAEAERKEAAQHELFCRCLREMEESGSVSYWSVLFNATDFQDLLSRLDAANEILEYRRGVIETMRRLQADIADKQAALEDQLGEQEDARAELESKKAELDQQVADAAALISEIQSDQAAAEALMKEKEAEYNRIQAQIKQMEKELAAQMRPATAGGYIWPVSSRRITSPYGNRNTGIAGASTNHKGVDIGGVGYTTPVVATKAGVVLISQRSSSYGEYVVISHGTGNTTLYAHMSSRCVSVGDKVTQGQKIGVTGSTGISSGPHLHYEITENGARVNPLNYLPGYIKCW